jgi:hypothetical protein
MLVLTLVTGATGKALPADSPREVNLLNGKDLSGWSPVGGKGANQWKVGAASVSPDDPAKLVVAEPGTDLVSPVPGANLVTETSFGDCTLELEFMIPRGSNSGIKMMRIYEVQILDSFGRDKMNDGDCGAIYKEAAPRVNACRKFGEWQKLEIRFRAPRFGAEGKKTENARFEKVVLNGVLIQENVEVAHGTNVSRNAPEFPTGPVFIQGDHGPIALRNLRITPLP